MLLGRGPREMIALNRDGSVFPVILEVNKAVGSDGFIGIFQQACYLYNPASRLGLLTHKTTQFVKNKPRAVGSDGFIRVSQQACQVHDHLLD